MRIYGWAAVSPEGRMQLPVLETKQAVRDHHGELWRVYLRDGWKIIRVELHPADPPQRGRD